MYRNHGIRYSINHDSTTKSRARPLVKVLISLYMLDVRSPPGGVLPGDASVLCVPSCDLFLPHVSCHLILHQNLECRHRITGKTLHKHKNIV